MYLLNLNLLLSMYLFYQVEIRIGDYVTTSVNAVEIKSSWRTLTDTAEIILPRNLSYRPVKNPNDIDSLRGKPIDQLVKRGDPVTVKLGYHGEPLFTEFTGYVREIEPNVPLKLSCEDEMYNLKKGSITKSWPKVSLADLVKFVAPGYETEVIDLNLGKITINAASPAQVLESLKDYGVFCYFRDKVLHAGFAYDYKYESHVYDFQRNIKSHSLKFRRAGDYPIQVKAIANLNNGRKTVVLYPVLTDSDKARAEVRTLNFGPLSDNEKDREKLLKQYAQAELKRFKPEGYRGSVTGFCVPFIRHGDNVRLRDARYPEHDSTNLVDSVNTKFAVGQHYERVVEIGQRV